MLSLLEQEEAVPLPNQPGNQDEVKIACPIDKTPRAQRTKQTRQIRNDDPEKRDEDHSNPPVLQFQFFGPHPLWRRLWRH
jgi:hypothetical protein